MRIGLIAMSGIRACDAELLRVGLTLPGFVERSKAIASLPSLGLLTLAGMTPPQHEIIYREVPDVTQLSGQLEPFDLVAISTFTAQADEAYALADRYCATGTPVAIGGLHVTAEPDEASAHCDAVVVGAGEPVWWELLADAEAGRLKPFYRSGGRPFDLASGPMPAYELLDISRYNRLTVQTSRGCPFRCTFCASSVLLSETYRQKPAARVLAEVDRIRELWRRPFIELADDNSFVDRRYWKELLPRLADRRIRWFTETDVSVGQDDKLLELLADAGCVEVLIGLESPCASDLAGLELHSDWKRRRVPGYHEAVRNIQSHGIRVNGCFILGLDGQGPETFDRVFDYAAELELFDVQVTLQTPFPGTPLHARLRDEGRLPDERPWKKCTLFDVAYQPKGMPAEELAARFRDLVVRLYSREQTEWRRRTFERKYFRPSRVQPEMQA
ncbi:MAG: Hopanoid C-2 methylase [Phycisphaerae bacterium]|nr:Hopanoid C-2 methylase [Phycisphaerae bacterium]